MNRCDPSGQIVHRDAGEPCVLKHISNLLLIRKHPNTFREITVTRFIARNATPQHWQYTERPRIVEWLHCGYLKAREFQAKEPAAWLKHAARLRQYGRLVRAIAETEGN